jgi:CheY-like chemotaxis protein
LDAVRRRVLVVDDNADALESLCVLLLMSGHEVHTACDGYGAIAAALRVRPEFPFLDIGLLGVDGFEVAKRLRQEPALSGMRIIAITGYGTPLELQRSMEAGIRPASSQASRSALSG